MGNTAWSERVAAVDDPERSAYHVGWAYHARLNGPTTGPNQVKVNGSCHAHPIGCRSDPTTIWGMLQDSPSLFSIAPNQK
jgi:hypothetical protein